LVRSKNFFLTVSVILNVEFDFLTRALKQSRHFSM
jgi:hypothetical protein